MSVFRNVTYVTTLFRSREYLSQFENVTFDPTRSAIEGLRSADFRFSHIFRNRYIAS